MKKQVSLIGAPTDIGAGSRGAGAEARARRQQDHENGHGVDRLACSPGFINRGAM